LLRKGVTKEVGIEGGQRRGWRWNQIGLLIDYIHLIFDASSVLTTFAFRLLDVELERFFLLLLSLALKRSFGADNVFE
jgi:hypothetical protein